MLLPEAAGNWNQYTRFFYIQYSYLVSLNLLKKWQQMYVQFFCFP